MAEFAFFVIFHTCVSQLRFFSNVTPRYFALVVEIFYLLPAVPPIFWVKLHDNGPPSTAVNDVSLSVTFLGPFFPYSLILETFVCKESACLCHCSGYYFMKSRNNNGPRTVP